MNKLTAFLLCLCMLACMAACESKGTGNEDPSHNNTVIGDTSANSNGDSDTESPEEALYRKYEDIINYLENERYTDAVQRIAELSNKDKTELTPISQLLEAKWYRYSKIDKVDIADTIEIKDGKVTVGDIVYTWLQGNEYETGTSG